MIEKGCIMSMKLIRYPNLHINFKHYNKEKMMYNKTETINAENIMSKTTLESSLNYYHKSFPTYFYIED